MASSLRVGVVVATHNRRSLLRGCLDCLFRQTIPPTEIVIVDDGSEDGTPRLLAGMRDRVRVIRNEVSRGPAAARNQGWRQASCEFIAFTDDDCEQADDWLHALGQRLDNAPPHIAGVGGRVLSAAPGAIGEYMTLFRILEPPSSLDYLVTANCIYRRAALQCVDGFDERVRQPGGEDPGLSLKLAKKGFSFEFKPNAVVRHHYRESALDFARTFFRYGKGCRLVMA